jgi:hypothetical protein
MPSIMPWAGMPSDPTMNDSAFHQNRTKGWNRTKVRASRSARAEVWAVALLGRLRRRILAAAGAAGVGDAGGSS